MNFGSQGLFVHWAILVGFVVVAVNSSVIHVVDDQSGSSFPGGKQCPRRERTPCPAEKLTTELFVHQCVTALFTIYMTEEPFIETYSLALTKFCPAGDKKVYITDCYPLLQTVPPEKETYSTEYCYYQTQEAEVINGQQRFSYFVTVTPEMVHNELAITFNNPGECDKEVVQEVFTDFIPGDFTYKTLTGNIMYQRGLPPFFTHYMLHYRKLQSQAPEIQVISTRLINENTQQVKPVVFTFVYKDYVTEPPIATSYLVEYTSYVEVPAQKKEGIITYTDYVTEAPTLVEFTRVFTYLAGRPLVDKEISIELTVYVTKPLIIEQKELTFTFFETVEPTFERRTVVITYYVTQGPGIDLIAATLTEFATAATRIGGKIVLTREWLIPGATKKVEVVKRFTAYAKPEMVIEKITTNYVICGTALPDTTSVVLTFEADATVNVVTQVCTEVFTACGIPPLREVPCHRAYQHRLSQHLITKSVVIHLTKYVTDAPEITSAVCQYTFCCCDPNV